MTRVHLIVLALLTAVFAGSTVLVADWRAGQYELAAHGLLYPDLKSELNGVRRVRIDSAGREPVTLESRDGEWVVAGKAGYPAQFDRLRALLRMLAQTEIVEAKTRRPAYYARLGVQPVDQADYGSYEIELWNTDDELLAHLVVGTTGATGGNYVRKADAEQAWLISERLSPPLTAENWLSDELLALDPARIRRIEIEPPEGKRFALVKSEPGRIPFELQPPLNEKQKLAVPPVRRLLGSLQGLRLEDVMAREQVPDDVSWHRLRIETFDGLEVVARLGEADGGRQYLKLEAGAPAQPRKGAAAQPELAKAEKLRARWRDWAYILPDYQAEALTVTRAELIEQPQAGQGKASSGQAVPQGMPAGMPEGLPFNPS